MLATKEYYIILFKQILQHTDPYSVAGFSSMLLGFNVNKGMKSGFSCLLKPFADNIKKLSISGEMFEIILLFKTLFEDERTIHPLDRRGI